MVTPSKPKSTVEEIRQRFDNDVERFADIETGQSATMDAPLAMELITQAAIASTRPIENVLDVGCGAGNNTIKLRLALDHDVDATLVDLSRPMLDRAVARLGEINSGRMETHAADFRAVELKHGAYDVVLAAAVLHHLRDDDDWQTVFRKIFNLVRPGGSVWMTDLVFHETASVHRMMWDRYGQYLASLGGEDYRDKVYATIDREDSPRPVTYQLELLRAVGFHAVELLHKNACFAAFGAIKRQ